MKRFALSCIVITLGLLKGYELRRIVDARASRRNGLASHMNQYHFREIQDPDSKKRFYEYGQAILRASHQVNLQPQGLSQGQTFQEMSNEKPNREYFGGREYNFRDKKAEENALFKYLSLLESYALELDEKHPSTSSRPPLIVIAVPKVRIDFATSRGAHSAYINWTVNDGNAPVEKYSIQKIKNDKEGRIDIWKTISGDKSDYVFEELETNTAYQFRITATNSKGVSETAHSKWVTTMDKDPVFTLNFTVEKPSATSMTVYWSSPLGDIQDFDHYYQLNLIHEDMVNRSIDISATETTFVIESLEAEVDYATNVAPCLNYTNDCKNSGKSYRVPKFVPTVTVNGTTRDSITIEWSMPAPEQRDQVSYYKVMASRRDYRRVAMALAASLNHHVFENLTSKTNYEVKVAACGRKFWECADWSNAVDGITSNRDEQTPETPETPFALWSISNVAVILVVVLIIWMGIWKKRERASKRRFIEVTMARFKVAPDCLDPALNMADQAQLLPYAKKWEFPRKLVKLDKVLGKGAFGTVMKAAARSMCRGEPISTVAVKMVRATHRLDHMMALQRELNILAYLGKHVNVVNLLGACTANVSYGELLVIVEFCRFGNLRDYLLRCRADFVNQFDLSSEDITSSESSTHLDNGNENTTNTVTEDSDFAVEKYCKSTDSQTSSVAVADEPEPNTSDGEPPQDAKYQGDFEDEDLRPISTRDLLCWAWQVSRGMKFLGTRRVLHGDLAARNILLADRNIVKICDFGLAKSLVTDDIYKKTGHGPLPIKWMAIESIRDRVFSVKSDVWSFGVVLWEFFTLGETPYPGIRNESVYQKLADDFRMAQPKYASRDIHKMMLRCWDAEPPKRPSFEKLEAMLDDLLEEGVKTDYLDFDATYAEVNAQTLAHGERDYLTMSPSEFKSEMAETTV